MSEPSSPFREGPDAPDRRDCATTPVSGPPASSSERLERLVAARLDTMLAEAEAAPVGTPLPASRLREMQALAALLAVRERLEPAPPPRRWPAAAALAVALGAISSLLFVHVPHTEIDLDATVSEVAFTLAATQALTEPLVLRFVGIAGFETLSGPGSPESSHRRLALAADAADAGCAGSLTLDRLILPRGAQVDLQHATPARRVHLSLKAPGAALQLTLDGCVRSGGPAGSATAERGVRTVTVKLGPDEVDLDLEAAAPRAFELAPFVRVHDLSLSRIEHIADDDSTLVRRVSTVDAGTLAFDALDSPARTLRPAEPIRFGQADGELRSVGIDDRQIALRFHGDVRGMASGSDAHLRSWMPTCLEWLKANHGISLFWAAATSAFALLMALLKWWKPSR